MCSPKQQTLLICFEIEWSFSCLLFISNKLSFLFKYSAIVGHMMQANLVLNGVSGSSCNNLLCVTADNKAEVINVKRASTI